MSKRMTFKKVEQGYDPTEVDHYVDLLSTRYEILHQKHVSLEAEHQRLIASRAGASSSLAGSALLPAQTGDRMTIQQQLSDDDMMLVADEEQAALLAEPSVAQTFDQPTFAPAPERVEDIPFSAPDLDDAQNHPRRSWLSRLASVLFYLLLAALLIAALSFVISDNEHKSMMGYRWYWIETGSMEPVIPTGSLAIVRITDADDIRVGNDVTFAIGDDEGRVFLTHRVVAIVDPVDVGEERSFVTKGIANAEPDSEVRSAASVIGKVVAHVPYLGWVLAWMRANLVPVAVAAAAALGLSLLLRRRAARRRNRQQ